MNLEFLQTSVGGGIERFRYDHAAIRNHVIHATLGRPGTCLHGDTIIYTEKILGDLVEGLDQFERPHFEDNVGNEISPAISGIRCQSVFQKYSGDRIHQTAHY